MAITTKYVHVGTAIYTLFRKKHAKNDEPFYKKSTILF